jgi:uncharacterized protein (TIGR04255 family)
MLMKFSKPPIVELIAEFRWLPVTAEGVEVTIPTAVMLNGPEAEEFYRQFASILSSRDFGQSERLLPPGFPVPIYTPLVRFSRPTETAKTAIIQVGPGILSVHALPPYEDWQSFRPIIVQALKALMESRKPSNRSRTFTRVLLRYIDVFGPELTNSRRVASFIDEVLGVKIVLPPVMTDEAPDTNALSFSLTVNTKTRSNMDLTFVCGPHLGQNDGTTVVMDTAVGTSGDLSWNAVAPMDVLDTAHESIRRLFIGLTEPISSAMQPID